MRKLCAVLILLLTCFGTGGLALAQDAEVNARSEFEWGRDAYDRGRFDEALQHFERAYALSPRPALLFNIGRAADGDHENEKAIQAYEAYLSALPNADNREFVEARLAKLRGNAAPVAPPPGAPPSARQPPSAPPPQPYAAPPPPAYAPYAAPPASEGPSLIGARFTLGGRLGFGGTYTEQSEYGGYELEAKSDLTLARGFQIGAGYVWRYFGIGGEIRASWLKIKGTEWADIKARFLDIVVKPRGGYVFHNIPLELYGALPLGITIPSIDWEANFEDGGQVDDQPGVTVGFVAGVSYLVVEHFGVNAELGLHQYWTSTEYESDIETFSSDNDFAQGQLALNVFFKL